MTDSTAHPETDGIIDLYAYDGWYEVPAGWAGDLGRRIAGLTHHRDAFLFDGIVPHFRPDLVPHAEVAMRIVRALVGPIVIDPHHFWWRISDPYVLDDPYDEPDTPEFVVPGLVTGESSNWVADLITWHERGNPTPRRIDAARAVAELLDLIPPLDPLTQRLEACRRLARELLADEHRVTIAEAGWRDVYALVERTAERTDRRLLADLCDDTTRLLRPVELLDGVTASQQAAPVAPPSALEIAAASLQIKAERSGENIEVPPELAAVLGASRAARLQQPVGIDALADRGFDWMTHATAREDFLDVRRWMQASFELSARLFASEPHAELVWLFSYSRYVDLFTGAAEEGAAAQAPAPAPADDLAASGEPDARDASDAPDAGVGEGAPHVQDAHGTHQQAMIDEFRRLAADNDVLLGIGTLARLRELLATMHENGWAIGEREVSILFEEGLKNQGDRFLIYPAVDPVEAHTLRPTDLRVPEA
ncbi:MAG: hypothetical protein ACTH31_11445 [Pseudoclavibacter sp.]